MVKSKAAAAGIDLDIGEFPQYGPDSESVVNDPERPVKLVARIVARTADRIAPLKKLSRHLEGTETKAGLLSDLTAAAFDLYGRNSDEVERLVSEYIRNVQRKTASRRSGGGSIPVQREGDKQ